MEESTLPVPDPPGRSVAQFVTFICVCVVVESWVVLVAESCDISIINRAAQRRLLLLTACADQLIESTLVRAI
jgi:hypothetical protein